MAVGLVLITEGLIYALAPASIEALLETLRSLSIEKRRLMGLGALSVGITMVWIARFMGV